MAQFEFQALALILLIFGIEGNSYPKCSDPQWTFLQTNISIIVPMEILQANDTLYTIHPVPLMPRHPQCRLPSQSYVFQEQMSLEIIHRRPPQNTVSSRNTDSSGSNVLQLNPRSGALYLTETGYEQLIQDNNDSIVSLNGRVILNSSQISILNFDVKFRRKIDLCRIKNLKEVLTLSKYQFDVFENMEFISLGTFSTNAKFLNRCSPRKSLMCHVTKGRKYVKWHNGSLELIRPLDRENLIHKLDDFQAKLKVIVKCNVPETLQKFRKAVTIVVHDINDNSPKPIVDDGQQRWGMIKKTFITKGEELNQIRFALSDPDLPSSNEYKVEFLNSDLLSVIHHGKIDKKPFQCNDSSEWCPCRNCIFNGTILHINDAKFRAKRDISISSSSLLEIPVKIYDKFNVDKPILRSFVVRPSKLIIQSYDDRIQNTTSIRHVRSPETSFNITISLNAAKYTRVFDPRIQLGSPKRLRIAQRDWDTNIAEEYNDIIKMTAKTKESIIYLNNPNRLRKLNGTDNVVLKMKLLVVDSPGTKIFLTITFSKSENTANTDSSTEEECHLSYKCAEYSLKNECSGSCGISGRPCHWIQQGFKNLTYSTCSNDRKTCPDRICDSLEALSKYSICPQDCIPRNKIKLQIMWKNLKDRGLGDLRSPNDQICSCSYHGKSCSCMHKNFTSSMKEEEEFYEKSNEQALDDNYNVLTWILPLSFGVLLIVVAILLYGKRRLIQLFNKKKNSTTVELTITSSPNSKYGHRNFSGASSDLTNLSTISTRLSGPPALQQRSLSSATYGTDVVLSDFTDGTYALYHHPHLHHDIDRKWEIPRKDLSLEKTIGEGEFGKVMSAKVVDTSMPLGYKKVAVKMLKASHRREEVADLLSEFNILKDVNHPNVIGAFGVCTSKGGPVCIIMEFAENGSLRDYLRQSRGIVRPIPDCTDNEYGVEVKLPSPKELIAFAWQIAKGMEYLSGMKLVHRDLAARNVLLSSDMICKISDFGLTRDVYIDETYWKKSNGRIPVKWLSPESLRDHLYTTKSDVWSFGVLLWELVTLGNSPYPGVEPERLLHVLSMGYRMYKPDNCSDELYEIMTKCWHFCPDRRPAFNELVSWTEIMLRSNADYLDLSPSIFQNVIYLQPICHSNDSEEIMLNKPYETISSSETEFVLKHDGHQNVHEGNQNVHKGHQDVHENSPDQKSSCDDTKTVQDMIEEDILEYPELDNEEDLTTERDIFLPSIVNNQLVV